MTIWVVCKAAGETEFNEFQNGAAAIAYYKQPGKTSVGTLKLTPTRLSRLKNGKGSKNENAAWEVKEQDTRPDDIVDVSGAMRQ